VGPELFAKKFVSREWIADDVPGCIEECRCQVVRYDAQWGGLAHATVVARLN